MSGLELIKEKDVNLLDQHVNDIIKKAKKQQMILLEPHEDEIKKITDIILKFIKENKRKIYGGYALNMLIIDKNPNDSIYDDDDTTPFYSGNIYEDALASQLYRGRGIERRERLT